MFVRHGVDRLPISTGKLLLAEGTAPLLSSASRSGPFPFPPPPQGQQDIQMKKETSGQVLLLYLRKSYLRSQPLAQPTRSLAEFKEVFTLEFQLFLRKQQQLLQEGLTRISPHSHGSSSHQTYLRQRGPWRASSAAPGTVSAFPTTPAGWGVSFIGL